MQENCFHRHYASKMVLKTAMAVSLGLVGLSIGNDTLAEVTIGFLRDKSYEEEFFLVIETKEAIQVTG